MSLLCPGGGSCDRGGDGYHCHVWEIVLFFARTDGERQSNTLAHYLDLLAGAGMVAGLPKFAGEQVRQRASSPKLQVLNTALMSAQSGRSFVEARRDPELWGRLVESAVGAHLVNSAMGTGIQVEYWRDRGAEVDFVVSRGPRWK